MKTHKVICALLTLFGGIGLTVPIYIADIAFTDPALLDAAKLALLSASAVSALLGLVAGRVLLRRQVIQ